MPEGCEYISGNAQMPVLQLIYYTSSIKRSAKTFQLAQLLMYTFMVVIVGMNFYYLLPDLANVLQQQLW